MKTFKLAGILGLLFCNAAFMAAPTAEANLVARCNIDLQSDEFTTTLFENLQFAIHEQDGIYSMRGVRETNGCFGHWLTPFEALEAKVKIKSQDQSIRKTIAVSTKSIIFKTMNGRSHPYSLYFTLRGEPKTLENGDKRLNLKGQFDSTVGSDFDYNASTGHCDFVETFL